eukprot:18591_1
MLAVDKVSVKEWVKIKEYSTRQISNIANSGIDVEIETLETKEQTEDNQCVFMFIFKYKQNNILYFMDKFLMKHKMRSFLLEMVNIIFICFQQS